MKSITERINSMTRDEGLAMLVCLKFNKIAYHTLLTKPETYKIGGCFIDHLVHPTYTLPESEKLNFDRLSDAQVKEIAQAIVQCKELGEQVLLAMFAWAKVRIKLEGVQNQWDHVAIPEDVPTVQVSRPTPPRRGRVDLQQRTSGGELYQ